ncbi:class I SAM-dependent methyltransferase [Phenylobacterium soli]|uniref:Class I SAM-dependent methyltransferase n=1 Tax=Phenylobacterium soli TaxID=2170551 RepID=A0A328AQR6_9CAUL|nr:class I SAM-dependent methyltransferase [Phenylobacterium soli]RAK56086.1 class I SAM-dependent methyltransferase [Phenylobacterium soli]
MSELLQAESHFRFGENWKSFLGVLDDERIAEAEAGLRRLFPGDELKNARFLDIGCGSGLSSLAALRLGAKDVISRDIDADSVEATRRLREMTGQTGAWNVDLKSVFEMTPESDGTFDVVYSWGVLHHTGDMWRAVEAASKLVKPGGLFAIALYRKTKMCGFWRIEKRFYSRAPKWIQALMQRAYIAAFYVIQRRAGKNPDALVKDYKSSRGMDFHHDVHDWLGGYPYESARPEEVKQHLPQFELVREFVEPGGRGLLGSGCDEFVLRRI